MSYKPIKVTKEQYDYIRINLAGLVFHRRHDGKYWVKAALKRGEEKIYKFLDIEP